MRELLESMPSVISATAKLDLRQQMIAKSQLAMAKELDFVASVMRKRNQYNSVRHYQCQCKGFR